MRCTLIQVLHGLDEFEIPNFAFHCDTFAIFSKNVFRKCFLPRGAIYCTQGWNIIYTEHAALSTSCIFFIITNVAPEACHTAVGLVLDSPVAATLHLHDFVAAAQIKAELYVTPV